MGQAAIYDRIGRGYAQLRVPDPRIQAAIENALGGSRTICNLGAGAGSYEPQERAVVAVEPSREMLRQRAGGRAPAVQATAGRLPFADATFGAASAILTLHHWGDWRTGLAEARRVATDRIVLVTWFGGGAGERLWLLDYFPEIEGVDEEIFPSRAELEEVLGPVEARVLPIPADCSDGFLAAYWARPERYLEEPVRAAISSFARVADPRPGLGRLREDLASGAWERAHGHLRGAAEMDYGYRIVVAAGGSGAGSAGDRGARVEPTRS